MERNQLKAAIFGQQQLSISKSMSGGSQPAHAGNLASYWANAGNRRHDRFERNRHVIGGGMHERGFVSHDGDVTLPEHKITSPQLLEFVRAREGTAQCLLLHVAV